MKPSGGGGGDWLGLGEDNGDSKSLELTNASLKSSSSFSNDIKKDTPETQGMVSEFSYASLIRKVCPGTKCVPVKGITTKEIFPTADHLFGPVIFFDILGCRQLLLAGGKVIFFCVAKTCCPQAYYTTWVSCGYQTLLPLSL